MCNMQNNRGSSKHAPGRLKKAKRNGATKISLISGGPRQELEVVGKSKVEDCGGLECSARQDENNKRMYLGFEIVVDDLRVQVCERIRDVYPNLQRL